MPLLTTQSKEVSLDTGYAISPVWLYGMLVEWMVSTETESPSTSFPTRQHTSHSVQASHSIAIIVAIVLVAANLRPALSSVSPLIDRIGSDLGLSALLAGALTTLPVLCFGLLAPAAPRLARTFGIERVLFGCMLALTAGVVGRVLGGVPVLFAGTAIAGSAIALGNVLLPALVKRDFPERIGTMTGIYTMALSSGAGLAAGASVPISHSTALGWHGSLACWGILSFIAAIVLIPTLRGCRPGYSTTIEASAIGMRRMLRSKIAWYVTLFMGLQSLAYYSVLAWLPEVYRSSGYDAATSGLFLSVSMIVGIPVALLTPIIAGRLKDQRVIVLVLILLAACGYAGLLWVPATASALWAVLLGIGLGGLFPLVLTLVPLRTQSPRDTELLSSLSQSIGYLVAAVGPLLVGGLHDITSGWGLPLLVLLLLLLPQLLSGLGASRNRYVV